MIRVLTEADDLARPIDLDGIALTDEATTGDPIFMFGYPVNGLENSVEYNDDATTVHVHRQRWYLEALYERPDTSRYLQTAPRRDCATPRTCPPSSVRPRCPKLRFLVLQWGKAAKRASVRRQTGKSSCRRPAEVIVVHQARWR